MWLKHKTSILITSAILALFSLFWFVPNLAVVLFVSILLTLLLNPVVDKITYKKINRTLASLISLILFITLALIILTSLSKTLIPSLAKFINDLPLFTQDLKNHLNSLSPEISQQIELLFQNLASFSIATLTSSVNILLNIFSSLLDIVMIVFITFYLLADGKEIKHYICNLFPKTDYKRVNHLLSDIILGLTYYIRGQLAVCLITGIVVFLYFSFCGLPYGSVFAFLSAIAEFIPVIGPTFASGLGILFALTNSTALALQTSLFYLILTQVNHNIVFPTLIGKTLNIHPVVIMISLLFFGKILGILGMFLAVPIIVIFKLLIEDINNSKNSD